jgi:hypothetical protein
VHWQDEQGEEASQAFAKFASPPSASQKLASVKRNKTSTVDAEKCRLLSARNSQLCHWW